MLHDLADRDTLPSAVRLNSTGRSAGFLAGPLLGSVLLLALRAGSGVSIGLVGGLIGIHWSLGLSALILVVAVIGLVIYTARAAAAQLRWSQRLQQST